MRDLTVFSSRFRLRIWWRKPTALVTLARSFLGPPPRFAWSSPWMISEVVFLHVVLADLSFLNVALSTLFSSSAGDMGVFMLVEEPEGAAREGCRSSALRSWRSSVSG